MAVTADEVLVRMSVQHQDYMNKMRQAEQSAAKVNQQLKVLHETTKIPLRGPTSQWAPVEQGVRRVNAEMKNLQFNTGNIFAQFNDIGVTAAMGMNPMMIALQQGTQLAQAFAGQRPGEVVKGLGAAFRSIVSPTTLLTIGLVAASAALIQWGLSAITASDSAEEFGDRVSKLKGQLDDLRSISEDLNEVDLDSIQQKYGAITAEILALVAAQERLARRDATKGLKEMLDSVKSDFGMSFWQELTDTSPVTASRQVIEYEHFVENLRDTLKLTQAEADTLAKYLDAAFTADSDSDRLDGLTSARDLLISIADRGGEGAEAAEELLSKIVSSESFMRELIALTQGLPDAYRESVVNAEELLDAQRKLKLAQTEAKFGKDSPEYALAELSIEQDILQERLKSKGVSDATAETILRMVEGSTLLVALGESWRATNESATDYIKKSLADREKSFAIYVEELRVAEAKLALADTEARYGKDSVEYAEARAEADREALRARLEGQGLLDSEVDAIIDIVTKTDEAAAATARWQDIMYGVRAVIAGIISDLAALGGTVIDTAGASVELRLLREGKTREEAARGRAAFVRETEANARLMAADNPVEKWIATARNWAEEKKAITNQELSDERQIAAERERNAKKSSGGGGGARARKALDDAILKDIAALNAEADVLEKVRPGWDRYGTAVERARKEAELLQQAENKGIPITNELREAVSQLGADWEKAAERQAIAQERLDRIKSTSQEVSNSLRSAFDGLFDDPIESLKRLGEELAMIALKMTLAKYLPNVFGIGGFMDLGYSGGGRSIGGYTGAGGVNQPAGVVHKGEVVWSQHDIARAGGVATVEAMRLGLRGYASGGTVDMSGFSPVSRGGGSDFILIDQREASAPEIETKTQRGPNGQEQVIAIVKKEWARGGFDSVAAARQGTGTRRVVR